MANKSVFSGSRVKKTKAKSKKSIKEVTNPVVLVAPPATTANKAGGRSYDKTKQEQLAQLVTTGCLNNTFYSTAESQLKDIITLANECNDRFIAQCAMYSRQKAFMKDMPALMMAILSTRNNTMFKQTYPVVINNPKMLRNFVQILRSGVLGTKTVARRSVKNMINKQLNALSDHQLLNATIGNDPSLADVIRLCHPKANNAARNAAYRWILGYKVDSNTSATTVAVGDLPPIFQQFELWKADPSNSTLPHVDFQLITGTPGIDDGTWNQLAKNGNWHFTRMNLNTFQRHNVYNDSSTVETITSKLVDAEQIKKARVFPYQLYTSLEYVKNIPVEIGNALKQALDLTVNNIPALKGKVGIFIDGSGSMTAPVTGTRAGATTKMSCIDVACLIGAGYFKKNEKADLYIFDTTIKYSSRKNSNTLSQNKSLLDLTNEIRSNVRMGGTNISCCFDEVNNQNYDYVIILSDNASWADYYGRATVRSPATASAKAWFQYRNRNPHAKLALVDLAPGNTTQVSTDNSVLNVGGFSNSVFDVITQFFNNQGSWVDVIENYTYTGSNNSEPVEVEAE